MAVRAVCLDQGHRGGDAAEQLQVGRRRGRHRLGEHRLGDRDCDGYADSDSHGDADSNRNRNEYADCHQHRDRDGDKYSDSDQHRDADCDDATTSSSVRTRVTGTSGRIASTASRNSAAAASVVALVRSSTYITGCSRPGVSGR